MRPYLGQLVHYVTHDGACRAAIVTDRGVQEGVAGVVGAVTLRVFHPGGEEVQFDVPYSTRQLGGTWHAAGTALGVCPGKA